MNSKRKIIILVGTGIFTLCCILGITVITEKNHVSEEAIAVYKPSVVVLSDNVVEKEVIIEEISTAKSDTIKETDVVEEDIESKDTLFKEYIDSYNAQRIASAKHYYGKDWEAIANYQLIQEDEMYDPERYTYYFGNPNSDRKYDKQLVGYQGSVPYHIEVPSEFIISLKSGDIFDENNFPLTSNFYGVNEPELPVENLQYFLLTEKGISNTFEKGKNVVICFFTPDYSLDSSYRDQFTWMINNVMKGDLAIVVEAVYIGKDTDIN